MLEITQHTHPFERYFICKTVFPKKNFHWWIRLLKNITPTQIQCRLGWAKFHEVCIAYDFDCPIPLPGLIGVTAYYLLRVVWQFSALQEIPPPLRSDLFKFDLPHKDLGEGLITHLQEKLNHITYTRKNCPKQVVVWPHWPGKKDGGPSRVFRLYTPTHGSYFVKATSLMCLKS